MQDALIMNKLSIYARTILEIWSNARVIRPLLSDENEYESFPISV